MDSRNWSLHAVLAVLLCGAPVIGQVGANISGIVTDNTGGVLPEATVILKNTNTGLSQVLTTGPEGKYRAVNLQPADYEIRANAAGFGVVKRLVNLPVGSDITVDLSLPLADVNSSVSVVAETGPLVEVAKSQPSSVINQQKLAELPVLDRNFLIIAQTMPGAAPVVNLNVTATRFAVTKFGGVADQASGYTTIIDGAPLDDSVWGVPVINMSQDSIQEFKVYRNQFDAQYGHALNAVVNVVTQSGGDKFHGTGYYFGRDATLNARNALATKPPPYDLNRGGGTFGGPINKNSHFFGAFEYLKIDTATVVALPPSNPFASQQNGNYPYTKTEKMADLKIDHQFSNTNNFYARYAWDSQISPSGGPTDSQSTSTDHSPAHSLVLEDNWILSPQAVNTVRYYFLHQNLNTVPANYDLGVTRPDYSFGQNTVDPQYFRRTNHSLSDTIFLNRAKQDIKIGVDATKAYNSYDAHFYEHGLFTFTTDAPFDINNAATWPQSFVMEAPGNFHHREMDYGAFAQDDWRILPNLRFNIGLRL